MVITDFESDPTSREASGRFQVTPEYRTAKMDCHRLKETHALAAQLEMQRIRDRIRTQLASRQIVRQLGQH